MEIRELTGLSKRELRQYAQTVRGELDLTTLSRQICAQLAGVKPFQTSKSVLFFYPRPGEVDLTPLCQEFPEKQWFLPRILSEERMAFHRYSADVPLTTGPYGIPEPPETEKPWAIDSKEAGNAGPNPHHPTLMILPALMVDTTGHRLGYGKGYYDRYLAELPDDRRPILATVIPDALLIDRLPSDTWDCPVRWVITESRTLAIPT